jgi:hypothetical protein
MSQKQYLRILEKEIKNINQKIDLKIIRGESYKKEARDHKLLLRKIRLLSRRNFLKNLTEKFFPTFASF